MPDLIIKLNRNPSPNNCPLCGTPTNPNIGAELFLDGTEQVVCLDCGTRCAPTLAALLMFGDYSRLFDESSEPIGKRLETYFELSKLFVKAERKFGDIWEWEQSIKQIPKSSFGFQTEVK